MKSVIKIGTRNSQLALWQAKLVSQHFEQIGYKSELVPISTNGDHDTTKPIYEIGIQGVFTKALDIALLAKEIDIAVHSLKDVPTTPAEGIVEYAVLKRGNPFDVLIFKTPPDPNKSYTIGTSSLRRRQQWLNHYPNHKATNLRGNINTRLKKLSELPIDGTILALAGLERLNLMPKNRIVLDWMIPAPGQGVLGIFGLEDNPFFNTIKKLNHIETAICTNVERTFLRIFEKGCSAPIGAYAQCQEESILFEGTVSDGQDPSKIIRIKERLSMKDAQKEISLIAKQTASSLDF